MRWLRRYLILSGVLFNVLLVIVLLLDHTASTPFLRDGVKRVLEKVGNDHPHLRTLSESLLGHPAVPEIGPAPEEPVFSPVPVLADADGRKRSGRILHVGPGSAYNSIAEVAKAAGNGDTILIAPGRYPGGVAIWTADDLWIKGDDGMVVIDATGKPLPQEKAIWVIQGDNTRVENIEFTGAASRDANGAGIRAEGTGLHVVNCFFHHNQDGILTRPNPESVIVIEHSEFAWNGHPNGQAHNVYIGDARRLVFRFNYVHHAVIGSNLKSRARENQILYNRIMDYADGRVNYSIDLSNGGVAYLIGNIIQQGPYGENYHLLTFAPEGAKYPHQDLYVVNNTFVNDRPSGQFIRNNSSSVAHVYNNLFIGPGGIVTGGAILLGNVIERKRGLLSRLLDDEDHMGGIEGSGHNLILDDVRLRSRSSYDYHLLPSSPAVDAGLPLEAVDGFRLEPSWQYRHPRGADQRRILGRPDAGAYGS